MSRIAKCLSDVLSESKGYVTIRCGACKHESTVTVKAMARMVGDRARWLWKDMQRCLTCRSCGVRRRAEASFWEAL